MRSTTTMKFTDRQTDIVKLVSEGYHNRKISEMLCVSQKTVEHHLVDIYDKLNAMYDTSDRHPRSFLVKLYLEHEINPLIEVFTC